jgi:hypothetical protein
MPKLNRTILTGTACLLATAFGAVLDPNLPIHDPSRMVYDNGFWFIYATGTAGIDVKYSQDKIHWSQGTPILGSAVNQNYWAPDIWNGKINGKFYLFYSQPTGAFGTNFGQAAATLTVGTRGGSVGDSGASTVGAVGRRPRRQRVPPTVDRES